MGGYSLSYALVVVNIWVSLPNVNLGYGREIIHEETIA